MRTLQLSELEEAGVCVEEQGGRLIVSAPTGRITSDVLESIRANKGTLISALLSRRAGIVKQLRGLATNHPYARRQIQTLRDEDVDACFGLADALLEAYVSALNDVASRAAGVVPASDHASALCLSCGPIYLAPETARGLPLINGWHTAQGCPWCVSGRILFPRPPVSCGTCQRFVHDAINPSEGAGMCQANLNPQSPYPSVSRTCSKWRPVANDALVTIADPTSSNAFTAFATVARRARTARFAVSVCEQD